MTTMNFDGLRRAENGAGERDEFARMRALVGRLASDPAMFGQVPNAGQAARALQDAATAMFDVVHRAGETVRSIRDSAHEAAEVGRFTDAEARSTLTRAQRDALAAFVGGLDHGSPQQPVRVDGGR
ncbi:hypothetical protein ACTWP5_00805 [Streptomyces sp. 4N509B]|uniref:hypothetical protein n=1 Tax=Streptomyces sp. 4N509B TaxID=3457413 RepID=UPI003FD6B8A8